MLEADMTGKLLDDFLSEKEFAKELGVSPRTLRNWRQLRVGPPFVTIGKRINYRRASGLAWLESQEHKPLGKQGRA